MAKASSTRHNDMPKGVMNVLKPRPITVAQYMVVNADTGKILKEENRLWYVIDNAGRRDAQGENVDVVGWDDTIGAHRPISEYMLDKNEHGDVKGDWRAVYAQRQEAARVARKKAPKDTSARTVKRDDETADRLKKMSFVLNVASTAIRKGELPEDQLEALYQEMDALTTHIYGLLPDPQPETATVE